MIIVGDVWGILLVLLVFLALAVAAVLILRRLGRVADRPSAGRGKDISWFTMFMGIAVSVFMLIMLFRHAR